jgi:hypothetical protein
MRPSSFSDERLALLEEDVDARAAEMSLILAAAASRAGVLAAIASVEKMAEILRAVGVALVCGYRLRSV